MDSIRTVVTLIKEWLAWLPNPVVATLILALAVAASLALHKWLRKLVRRLLAKRYPNFFSIFTQIRDFYAMLPLFLEA